MFENLSAAANRALAEAAKQAMSLSAGNIGPPHLGLLSELGLSPRSICGSRSAEEVDSGIPPYARRSLTAPARAVNQHAHSSPTASSTLRCSLFIPPSQRSVSVARAA